MIIGGQPFISRSKKPRGQRPERCLADEGKGTTATF